MCIRDREPEAPDEAADADEGCGIDLGPGAPMFMRGIGWLRSVVGIRLTVVSGTTLYVPLVRLDIGVRACGVIRGHVDAGATCGSG
eukprot:2998792-Prorocentrum_lima.AAC.1